MRRSRVRLSRALRFFFSLSRALRDVRVTAPRSVWGERRHRGAKKIDSGRGARRANDRGSMRWNVNEYRRVIHSNLRLFRDRWTWDCTSRARDGFFFFSLCSSLLLPRKPITFCFIHFIYTIASRLVTHPHSFSFFSHFHARKQQFKDNPRRGKR